MKTCKSCLESKDAEEFSWKYKKENRRHLHCRVCVVNKSKGEQEKKANEKKECRVCLTEKLFSEFGKDLSKTTGFRNECKECIKKYNAEYTMTKDGKLRHLWNDAKSHVKKRAIKNEIFSLRYEDLIEKWSAQKHKCFYSGMEMHYDNRNWQVSLERLDTKKGYSNENTALCCLEFNNQAQWSHEKMNDMIMNVELSEVIKPIDVHDISNKSSDMYHHLKRLFDRCVLRSGNNDRFGTSDLSLDLLIELFKAQNGRCAYSGIPLRCGTSENSWIASLDRIDPLIGYKRENVCLTCLEFNTIDHTSTYSEIREGETSGWNKGKFAELYNHLKQTPRFTECMRNLPRFKTDIRLDVVKATCIACKKQYNKKAKYAYRRKCEKCIKTHNFDRFHEENESSSIETFLRVCKKCHEEKRLLNDFSKSATSSLGYNTICKECKNERKTELKTAKNR